MSHSGRLPPLQVIGRSQRIELDEPPDLANEDIDDLISRYDPDYAETTFIPPVYTFKEGDGENTAGALAKIFKVVQPGNHICKRAVNECSSFTHCRQSVSLAAKYAELRAVLEKKAQLKLIQDYATRVQAASQFIIELQRVVSEEYQMWYDICHSNLQSPPNTKLESLGAILEDLRSHTGHWNSLKQRLHSDQWLSKVRHVLMKSLEKHQTRLLFLRGAALWWVDRLIHIGLRVLAHCDLERLSPDALWTITRGLEDYNTLLINVKVHPVLNLSSTAKPHWSSFHANDPYNIQESLQPIQFPRILNLLASERAHYAAATTQQFFTNDADFLKLILKKPLPAFDWSGNVSGSSNKKPESAGVETSDYFTGTGAGSQVSLGTAMLQVGQVIAPDLSQNAAPLFDFSRRENTFARRFLQIVFHSTSLLKSPSLDALPKPTQKSSSHRPDGHQFSPRLKLPRGKPEGIKSTPKPNSKSTDSKRKTVSWSDAGEMSVIQVLTERYMDLLWLYTRQHLIYFVHNATWSSGEGWPTAEYLGSTDLCPVTGRMLIVRMIQQTSIKDIFPVGVVPALHSVAQHMQATAAWAAWDQAICSSLASQISDKCYPTPLVDSEFCSKTAVQLRNSFHPISKLLQIMDLPTSNDEDSGDKAISVGLLLPTMHRLHATCDLAMRWCHVKSSQFLAAQAISPFMLVTQSDLKLLCDEMWKALQLCRHACLHETSSPIDKPRLTEEGSRQLASAWTSLNTLYTHFQVLSGSSMKEFQDQCRADAQEFFSDEMPTGKIWRKKHNQGGAMCPMQYATQAVQVLLEPILAAVGQLASTAQLTVMSVAVSAVSEAWLHFIRTNKIKFSFHGARQLETDFTHIKRWLQTRLEDEDVRNSVLALDVFKHMHGVICLLQQQPGGSHPGRSQTTPLSSLCCDMGSSGNTVDPYLPSSSAVSTNGASYHIAGVVNLCQPTETATEESSATDQSDKPLHAYKVTEAEDWLALRVSGGHRTWIRLPGCLHKS